MRTRRILGAVAIAAAALLPAIPAPAASCLHVEIAHDEVGPNVVDVSGTWDGSIRYNLAGDYLQAQFGHADDPDAWLAADIVSVNVNDKSIVSADICDDLTITLNRATAVEPTVANLPDLFPDIVFLTPVRPEGWATGTFPA